MQNPITEIVLLLLALFVSFPKSCMCQDRLGYTEFESAVLSGILPVREFAEAYYNETDISEAEPVGLQSAPGCPEPFEGHPWVYYGETPKCHLSGYKWPCPANMKLFGQRGSSYGYCDCDCKHFRGDQVNFPRAYCYSETKLGNARTLVYVKEWDSCHSPFDQAKCPEGQWLVFGDDPKLGPYCDQRKCPEIVDKNRFYFYDYQNRVCHRLRDECRTSQIVPNQNGSGRKRVKFIYQTGVEDWIPQCDIDELANLQNRTVSNSIARIACGDRERFSPILERCVPIRGRLTYGIG